MPKADRVTNIEKEKRLRTVQEWLIQDWPHCDIENECVKRWDISTRQAKRYIATALEKWVEGNEEKLKAKKARRIESLKRLKRSLGAEFANRPSGISVLLRIERELIRLEGVVPTEQMIEAEAAVDKGKQSDPLSPESNKLIIEAILPYGHTQAPHTPDNAA